MKNLKNFSELNENDTRTDDSKSYGELVKEFANDLNTLSLLLDEGYLDDELKPKNCTLQDMVDFLKNEEGWGDEFDSGGLQYIIDSAKQLFKK